MDTSPIPLVADRDLDRPLAWRRDGPVTAARFLAHVEAVSAALPAAPVALNLCEDRYLFCLTLAAAALRGQTTLLASTRAPAALRALAARHPGAYWIGEGNPARDLPFPRFVPDPHPPAAGARTVPAVPAGLETVRAFTSGSTGEPRPHGKSWLSLVRGAEAAQRRLGIGAAAGGCIVATVPPQHMYGLETSVMLPLRTRTGLHGGRPLFPEDLRAALAAVPAPRVLVTTPVHLKALAAADLTWPAVDLVVSATAPLDARLARQIERRMATRLMEIYGCTEAGSLASRRTGEDSTWRWYDGVRARFAEAGVQVRGGHLDAPVTLADVLEPAPEGRFRLLGRAADMVNIAGRRGSLAELNLRLTEIDGVVDGVFVVPEAQDGEEPVRLAALVVAPDLGTRDILAALAERIDPVFLPRPLRRVDRLPRDPTGKLPRERLLEVLRRAGPGL